VLAALVGLLLLLLLAPVPAWAHAELIESDPADGADLSAVPGAVTLTFSEQVTGPAQVAVTAPNGTQVQDGNAAASGVTVTQPVKPQDNDESSGSWTVAYRVVSVDGHSVTGEIAFTVDDKSRPTTATESQADAPSADSSEPAGSTEPADPSAWYTETGWMVVAVVAVLAAVLAWALRRRRDA
jgi:hypothetical protein